MTQSPPHKISAKVTGGEGKKKGGLFTGHLQNKNEGS